MRNLLFTICLIFYCVTAGGQPLRDINYNYLYNPTTSFALHLKAVKLNDGWSVLYSLQVRDSSLQSNDFRIEWETRSSLGDKDIAAYPPLESNETFRNNSGFGGKAIFPSNADPKILVAKVVQDSTKRAWLYYKILESNYPVDGYINVNNQPQLRQYIKINEKFTVVGPESRIISYYNDNFPAALPPFAESQGRVSQAIEPDSSLNVQAGEELTFQQTGLYLAQKDTSTTAGFTFRVEDDYPRLGRIPSLAGPLIYICTRDEISRLTLAKNNKKAFDRIILSITEDTDRARTLIKNYFRRVELANTYFTSYKEGWKTDRGMIYIIFGMPEEVFKFSDREVWNYKNDNFKITFTFSKSSSIFDPENYVLIREKRFRETWLETVDLWRNARF